MPKTWPPPEIEERLLVYCPVCRQRREWDNAHNGYVCHYSHEPQPEPEPLELGTLPEPPPEPATDKYAAWLAMQNDRTYYEQMAAEQAIGNARP